MCRLAAYIGAPIALEQFLLKPAHSLLVQSHAPRETRYTRINADGFGFGWYAQDNRPAVYTSTLPIWADQNLPHLGRTLSSDIWLANVRSATPGLGVHAANTQPFFDDELLFMHNGLVLDFDTGLRRAIRDEISPEVEAGIHGTTDSEYLFALLCHLLREDEEPSVEDALNEWCSAIEGWLEDGVALLNVVITDGDRVFALRHAIGDECPSLYFTKDDERFPDAQVIASEPLTESEFWQPVPEHHLLVLDPEAPPELLGL